MNSPRRFLIKLIFPLLTFATNALFAAGERNFFEEGARLRSDEKWQEALQVWQAGKDTLSATGQSDPRIAIAFIELAVERQLRDHYEAASEIYFWGLSLENFKRYPEALKEELLRLLPLLRESEAKEWAEAFEKRDPSLISRWQEYWIERDPVLTTAANERLIEHWERIVYARKYFAEPRNSVYDTDDRGVIYVKFGQPDAQREISLGTNPNELMAWAELADFGSGPSFGRGTRNFSQLRQGMSFYMTTPDCEVWIYDTLDHERRVVFLFGPRDGSGGFGLREGVEDLIPDAAFRKTSARATGGLVPGGLLQLLYYGRLAMLDSSFEDRFYELESIWQRAYSYAEKAVSQGMASIASSYIRNTLPKEINGARFEFHTKDVINKARKLDTPGRSDVEININSLDFIASATRVLDSSNQPKIIFVGFEYERIFRRGQSFKFPSYEFEHKLITRDAGLRVVQQDSTQPLHTFTNTVVFEVPNVLQAAHYSVTLESFVVDSLAGNGRTRKPIGIGQVSLPALPPLDNNADQLEASDLVTGIYPPSVLEDVPLPFPVLPSSKFRRIQELQVYLELYHLGQDEGGGGRFSLDFQVVKLRQTDDGFKREERISTTFGFDTDEATSKETFGIDISNLDAGDYELGVHVTDKISGQKKQRMKRFVIEEDEDL